MIEIQNPRSTKIYPTTTKSTNNTQLRSKDRDPQVKIQKQIDQNKKPTSTKTRFENKIRILKSKTQDPNKISNKKRYIKKRSKNNTHRSRSKTHDPKKDIPHNQIL